MGDNQYVIDISTNADSTSVDELATKLQELESAANTAGTAIESIDGTSLDEAGNAADETATSLEEVGNAADEAGNATDSIDSTSVDELASSADEAADSLEDVESAADDATGTSVLGAGAATAAVATLTAGLEETAESGESANATFEKMSSATFPEAQIRAMVASLTNADFDTADALLYIKTLKQMGVTSQDALSKGAKAFNQIQVATGVSSDQIVRFSNSMVAMGIDMNNIPSTFNAIAYANANMVGGFKTYVDWMAKYDSTFKSMGLNVDQTAVLISAATKKFGGGKAAYSGLNEALKETGGNVQGLEKFFKGYMDSGALENASAETEKYSGKVEKNAEISEKHTTIMQKAAAAVEDLSTQYSGIIAPIASYGGAISGAITFMGSMITMKAALATAANTAALAQSAENVATNEGVLSKISSTASTVASTAATAAKTVATGAMTAALWLAEGAQNALNFAMEMNPIGIIIIAVIALVAAILYLWNTNKGFRNAIIGIWNGISGTVLNAVNTAEGYIRRLPGVVWQEMMNVGNMIGNSANYIFQQIENVFGNIVQWAMKVLGIASPGYIARAIAGEMGYVVSNILDAHSSANAAAKGLGDAILSGFGNPTLSVGTSVAYGSASLGYDATEINGLIDTNGNSQPNIVNYNTTVNQEGIMSLEDAADFIVRAVKDRLWKENLIKGKTE